MRITSNKPIVLSNLELIVLCHLYAKLLDGLSLAEKLGLGQVDLFQVDFSFLKFI